MKSSSPIERAMRRVARHWPVIYSKLLCLEWVETDENGCHPLSPIVVPYGATDGKHLLLNSKGVESMAAESQRDVGDPVGYVAFLLVHEGAHAILNHGFRLEKFADHHAANVAADYKVDGLIDLRNEEIGKRVFPIPPWAYLDRKLSDPYSTEQLYQHLRKNNQQPHDEEDQPIQVQADEQDDEQDNQDLQEGAAQPDAGSDPAPGETGPPCGDAGDCPDPADPDADGGGSDGTTGDRSPDPGTQPGDQRRDGGGPADAAGVDGGDDGGGMDSGVDSGPPKKVAGRVAGRPGDGSGDTFRPQLPPDEAAALEREIEETNEQIVLQDGIDGHQCGLDPASSRRLIGERNAPGPQDWCAYAAQFVETRCTKGWRYPFNHGIYAATGMVGPGREGKKVGDIVVVVDSSGSIGGGAWTKFFDLCQFILDDIEPEHLRILSCDTHVAEDVTLEPGEEVPRSLSGGGGTSFKAAFDWIEAHDIDPLLVIYFTDGLCEDHKTMDEPAYPVLWLSYQKKRDHFPWGEFAEITLD